jgi:hypothetical protein
LKAKTQRQNGAKLLIEKIHRNPKIKKKKHSFSSQITPRKELVNNYYANKQTINKTILRYNHDIIKLNDDLTILTAGIEGFSRNNEYN